MASEHHELIVMRQLASYLAMPIFVQDEEGTLVYFNEPAEPILGRRFDETGALSRQELWDLFRPVREDGSPLPYDDSPFRTVRDLGAPIHQIFHMRGMDGIRRHVEGTAIPLTTPDGKIVGSFSVFWEIDEGA